VRQARQRVFAQRANRARCGDQLAFDDLDGWRLHAIITNVPAERLSAAEVEAHHRLRGGIPEDTIRALKNDYGMIHAPVQSFFGNWLYWQATALAHNVGLWLRTLALPRALRRARGKRLRLAFLNVAARLVRHGRRLHLRFAAAYPHSVDRREPARQPNPAPHLELSTATPRSDIRKTGHHTTTAAAYTNYSIAQPFPTHINAPAMVLLQGRVCAAAPLGQEAEKSGSDLDQFFQVSIAADDVARPKPDPQLYLEAFERLDAAGAHRRGVRRLLDRSSRRTRSRHLPHHRPITAGKRPRRRLHHNNPRGRRAH
jgi:hypothetical protein